MILMPIILAVNFTINVLEIYSPRDEQRGFNYPEFIIQIAMLILGYVTIIKKVKTQMLFTGLAYFVFGLMFAYEEIMREARNIMFRHPLYYNAREPAPCEALLPTYT